MLIALSGGDGVNVYDTSSSGKCLFQGYTGGNEIPFSSFRWSKCRIKCIYC